MMDWDLLETRLEDDEDEKNEKDEKERSSPIGLDLLKEERTIIISEEVSSKLTQRVMGCLLWLDSQSQDPINLYLNTPGGSADDGFAIHDLLNLVKSPVNIITLGLNASAGIIILLSTPAERRFALSSTRLMMHQPSGGGRGQSTDLEITATEIVKLRDKANVLISAQTGQPKDKVELDTDRDYWLSAEEAVEYGLVSKVISSLDEIA